MEEKKLCLLALIPFAMLVDDKITVDEAKFFATRTGLLRECVCIKAWRVQARREK